MCTSRISSNDATVVLYKSYPASHPLLIDELHFRSNGSVVAAMTAVIIISSSRRFFESLAVIIPLMAILLTSVANGANYCDELLCLDVGLPHAACNHTVSNRIFTKKVLILWCYAKRTYMKTIMCAKNNACCLFYALLNLLRPPLTNVNVKIVYIILFLIHIFY